MDIWLTPSPFHVHMVYGCPHIYVMENADSDDRLVQEIAYIYDVFGKLKKSESIRLFPPKKTIKAAARDLANVKKYGNFRSVFYA